MLSDTYRKDNAKAILQLEIGNTISNLNKLPITCAAFSIIYKPPIIVTRFGTHPFDIHSVAYITIAIYPLFKIYANLVCITFLILA